MTKPVNELATECIKHFEAYFKDLNDIAAQQPENKTDAELLKSMKTIILNYTYLKTMDNFILEPGEEIAKVLNPSIIFPNSQYHPQKMNSTN